MGVWSVDLCGLPLKELSGSWDLALRDVLGSTIVRQDGQRRPRYIVPATPPWNDERPPPAPSTVCMGELVPGSTTWLTNDASACETLIDECGFETATALGFDTEWTPTMVRGQMAQISLMQIATREHCLLLRIGEMRQLGTPLPARLVALLEGQPPLKVGRGIRGDAKMVYDQLGVDMRARTAGLVELAGKDNLKSLARQYASFPMPPEGKLSWCTNWDARTLSTDSLRYAALDAIAAADVYTRMPRGNAGAAPTVADDGPDDAPPLPRPAPISPPTSGVTAAPAARPVSKRRSRRQRRRDDLDEMRYCNGEVSRVHRDSDSA